MKSYKILLTNQGSEASSKILAPDPWLDRSHLISFLIIDKDFPINYNSDLEMDWRYRFHLISTIREYIPRIPYYYRKDIDKGFGSLLTSFFDIGES